MFPHLNSDLSEDEREEFEKRLKIESEDIMNKFAGLALAVKRWLKEDDYLSDLKYLIRNSPYDRVHTKIKNITEFDVFMEELSKYWSFFDYDLLGLIISEFCKCDNLSLKLKEYEKSLNEYCQRKLCEVPERILEVKADKKNWFCLKYNKAFKSRLHDIKELQLIVSRRLNKKIVLLEIKEGCIELTFEYLSITNPIQLNSEDIEEFKKMGIICMYTATNNYFWYVI